MASARIPKDIHAGRGATAEPRPRKGRELPPRVEPKRYPLPPMPDKPLGIGVMLHAPVEVTETPRAVGPMLEVRQWNSELTPELISALCAAAAIGGFKKQAAIACGVKPELLEWWLSEGMRDDAPVLMQELSARFLSTLENVNLGMVDVVRRAALGGEWPAALSMLKLREKLWSGNEKERETETAAPKSSLKHRFSQFVNELRNAAQDPTSDLARALREADLLPAVPGSPELPEPPAEDKGESPKPE